MEEIVSDNESVHSENESLKVKNQSLEEENARLRQRLSAGNTPRSRDCLPRHLASPSSARVSPSHARRDSRDFAHHNRSARNFKSPKNGPRDLPFPSSASENPGFANNNYRDRPPPALVRRLREKNKCTSLFLSTFSATIVSTVLGAFPSTT